MKLINHAGEPRRWAEVQFGEALLTDVRRVERLKTIGEALAANPGASIPRLFARPYDVKAAYAFFNHPEVEPDTVHSAHRAWVLEQMETPGTYLLIEDTTELDGTGRAPIPGLGPIGNHGAAVQGLRLHSVLAARWLANARQGERRPAVELVGVLDQQYHRRTPRPPGEAKGASGARKKRPRESQRWVRTSERIGAAPREMRWVRVGDAEADLDEHWRTCQEQGHGYVVRAGQDRALVAADGRTGHLYQSVRASSARGQFTVALSPRPGQAARAAQLHVSAQAVRLRAPQRPGAKVGSLPPVECPAVRVGEAEPPSGVEALEWILLSDMPVRSFPQAQDCALQYASRWLIEEFHKALKTGLGVERLQLETAERLRAAAALMSVVALRLVGLREQVRITPQAPAETVGLDKLTLEVLRTATHRPLQSMADVALAIGRLGGHLNRRHDGLPGWQCLWRGMKKLDLLVAGVLLSRNLVGFG